MKRLLSILFCLLPALLPAQWTNLGTQSIPLQMTSDYLGIRISHHPPAVPNTGPIWKLRNTNDDWVTEQIGYVGGGGMLGCCPVEAISFLNDSVGFVQYLNFGLKRIARTTDRGLTLTPLQAGGEFHLMPSNDAQMQALDDTTVYVVGETFSLTGTRALRITPTRNDTIFEDTAMIGEGTRILFLSHQVGFVIGTDQQGICRLYRTVNGGTNWSQRLAVNVGPMRAIDFIDDSTGYVAGASGVCYKTTDAGFTWNSLAINGPVDVYAMDFINAQVGYLGATGGIVLRTNDGGINWFDDVIDSTITVRYIKAITTTMAYALSTDSVLYKRDYVAGENAALQPQNDIRLYPNPSSDVVHIIMPDASPLQRWKLYDLQGQCISQGQETTVHLQHFPMGIYILEVQSNKGMQRLKVMRR